MLFESVVDTARGVTNIMKIKQNDKTLNVVIKEDAQTFYFLKSLIDKNFSNKIGNKNKIIIFNDSSEEVARKYFLKLLSRIYARKTDKKLKKIWQIEKAVHKTIKITLVRKNQLQNIINLNLNLCRKKEAVEISMDAKNRLILRGMQNIFGKYKLIYQPSANKVLIYNFDKEIVNVLKEFIHTKEILGNFINFSFKEDFFEDLSGFLECYTPKKIRKSVSLLLKDFYKLLHCSQDDSYEKVRANYLLLVKKYHPDNIISDNTLILKVYSKKFQKIQQAYKTIKEYHKHMGNVA